MFGKAKVHIAAFVAMSLWGVSYIWSKVAFEYFSPLSTVFFRLLISVVSLLAFAAITKNFEKIRKHDLWLFFVSALFNPFLYFIFESYGLQRVSASISAFIIATIPLFTPFLAYKVFGERLSVINVVGLGVSFLGVLLIIFNFDMSINTSPTGIILLFLAVASAVVYVVFLKRLSLSYTPVTIITVQNGIGVIYFLPLFLYADIPEIFAVSPSWQAVGSIILLGVLASSVAYVLFTYVIATIGISRGNMYANLIPLCAAVASYFILGEQFTIIKIVGMIVIIFGLVLSEIKFKKPTLKLDVN